MSIFKVYLLFFIYFWNLNPNYILSRDTFIYAASIENHGLDTAVKILGDVVLRPNITPEEIEDARMAIRFELEDMNMRPDQQALLVEMVHEVLYFQFFKPFLKI